MPSTQDLSGHRLPEQTAPSTPGSGLAERYVQSSGRLYVKDDAGQVYQMVFAGAAAPANALDGDVWINTNAAPGAGSISDHGDVTTTVTIDRNAGYYHRIRLTSASCAVTFVAPAAGVVFQVQLLVVQDGTGGRLLTFTNTVVDSGGIRPVLSTAAGAKDRFTFDCGLEDQTTWWRHMLGKTYS